jgi:hypothetical protein
MRQDSELLDEPTPSATAISAARPQPRRRSGDAATLSLVGLAVFGAGLALLVVPHLSWKGAKIAESLGNLGLQGGTLLVGGMSLLGLALVRRAMDSSRASAASEDTLLLEQVATDLVQLRGAMAEIGEETSAVRAALEEMRERAEAEAAAESSDSQTDAIFRLAASLDQLGARIEQRLDAQHTALRDGLDEIDTLLARTASPSVAQNGASAGGADPSPHLGDTAVMPRDDAVRSLGLLDHIEDAPQAPIPRREAFDAAAQAARDENVETLEKLERLSQLLSDERLRNALDALTR